MFTVVRVLDDWVRVVNGLEVDDADCFGRDIVDGVDVVDDDDEVDLIVRGLEGGGGIVFVVGLLDRICCNRSRALWMLVCDTSSADLSNRY